MMLQKQHIPYWLGDRIAILCTFLSQKHSRTLFVEKNKLWPFFVAKTIYALRLESFCALKVAIRKVHTFWASGLCKHLHWSSIYQMISTGCLPLFNTYQIEQFWIALFRWVCGSSGLYIILHIIFEQVGWLAVFCCIK